MPEPKVRVFIGSTPVTDAEAGEHITSVLINSKAFLNHMARQVSEPTKK